MPPVRGCVAPCGGFSPAVGNGYQPGLNPKCGRLGGICSLRFYGLGRLFPRVECQAGERVGAVNGPRLDSLRPEIPTAQGFFGFDGIQNYGAVFGTDAPEYGAVIENYPVFAGDFTVPRLVPGTERRLFIERKHPRKKRSQKEIPALGKAVYTGTSG